MSQTGFPNPRQAAGSGSEHSPSFPLISHNKYRAPWCQLTKAQFSECCTHSRLKTSALVGLICRVRSACSLAVHPLGCKLSPSLQAGCGAQLALPIREAGTWCRQAEGVLVKPWECSSRCQGTEKAEQTAAAIKLILLLQASLCRSPGPQVDRTTQLFFIYIFSHFALGLGPLALAEKRGCFGGRWGLCFRE